MLGISVSCSGFVRDPLKPLDFMPCCTLPKLLKSCERMSPKSATVFAVQSGMNSRTSVGSAPGAYRSRDQMSKMHESGSSPLGRARYAIDASALAHVDIVVEAVFEDLALKQQTFAELGRVTRPECILATNTSTLDVDAIAAASGRPGQVVGHHFFSPANIMTLLEIVRGRETSPGVLATSLKLAKHLGKTPVIVGNCFGFVANRILGYYLREALLLVEEGATVKQVDDVMSGFGMPVGPFAMEDIAGIDVGARIRQHRARTGQGWADGPRSPLPDRLYEQGRYGQKTGAGWYRYEPGSRERIPDPAVEALANEVAREHGITRQPIADDEILARIMTAMVNEGLRVVEEGFAQRPSDIDVVYCHGFGFPRYRGGPMFYAHTVGLPVWLDRVNAYRARFGDYWQPAPLLTRLVQEGRALYPDE